MGTSTVQVSLPMGAFVCCMWLEKGSYALCGQNGICKMAFYTLNKTPSVVMWFSGQHPCLRRYVSNTVGACGC